MNLAIIVAIDEKYGIWKDNNLLCHLFGDLKNFKEITTGHPIIMWRKTFQTFPKWALPNRTNIILSSYDYNFENCVMCKSIDDILDLDEVKNSELSFVIGWASVYSVFLPFVNRLYITRILHTFEDADVFFPEIQRDNWDLTYQSNTIPADERNDFPYRFEIYDKKI